MTTALRAALRAAAAILREDAQDHIDDARKQAAAPLLQMAERLEALADAPPTVAELQVDPRVIAGSHAFVMRSTPDMPPEFVAIRWGRGEVDAWNGPQEIEGWWFLPCDEAIASVDLADGWELYQGQNPPSDLTKPARLVEVA